MRLRKHKPRPYSAVFLIFAAVLLIEFAYFTVSEPRAQVLLLEPNQEAPKK